MFLYVLNLVGFFLPIFVVQNVLSFVLPNKVYTNTDIYIYIDFNFGSIINYNVKAVELSYVPLYHAVYSLYGAFLVFSIP